VFDDDDDDVIIVNQIFYGKFLIQLQLLYKSSKGTRILFSKEKFLVQWLMGSSIFYFLLSRTKSYSYNAMRHSNQLVQVFIFFDEINDDKCIDPVTM
jgi:hypothetical protein